MAFTVSYNEEDGFVHVAFSGIVPKDEHLKVFNEIQALCREHKSMKVLVDFSALHSSYISTIESFDVASTIAFETLSFLNIALVSPSHSAACDNVHFASNVLTNRGMLSEAFETVEEARTWLRQLPIS